MTPYFAQIINPSSYQAEQKHKVLFKVIIFVFFEPLCLVNNPRLDKSLYFIKAFFVVLVPFLPKNRLKSQFGLIGPMIWTNPVSIIRCIFAPTEGNETEGWRFLCTRTARNNEEIRLTPIGLSKLFAIFATSPIQLARDIEESKYAVYLLGKYIPKKQTKKVQKLCSIY